MPSGARRTATRAAPAPSRCRWPRTSSCCPAKSYLRKLVEIPLTFAIELAWPKRRILEVYLNIVEWGPGVFGAEAASQAHFGRSAIGLSSRQAAQLAVTLPNPIVRDAGDPGPRTAHRASVIQARAARNGEASACVDGGR